MTENICLGCDHEKFAPKGICTKSVGSDGGVVRCVGDWAKEKHYYLERYLDVFVKSMRNKWKLCYIDLFSGPGISRVRETGEEILSSPLLALNAKYPFDKYFFVDKNEEATKILEKRLQKACEECNIDFNKRMSIFTGDCNDLVGTIRKSIPKGSLSVCFADPVGLKPKFKSIKVLTAGRVRIDIIMSFFHSTIKRNLKQAVEQYPQILNDFMGNSKWISTYDSLPLGASDKKCTTSFIKSYREELSNLGYQETKIGSEIGINNLYYLLFASKNPLGVKFWKEVTKKRYVPQGDLFDND